MGFNFRASAGTFLLAVAVCFSHADFVSTSSSVCDFSRISDPSSFVLSGTTVEAIEPGERGSVARVALGGLGSYFGQVAKTPVDWSGYQMAAMTLTNRESRDVKLSFIVQVTSNAKDYTGAFNAGFTLRAGDTRRFVFHLNYPDPSQFGLKVMPPPVSVPMANVRDGSAARSYKTVYRWRLTNQESAAVKLSASDLQIMKWNTDFTGIVDRYGQFNGRVWDGRLTSEQDLANRWVDEQADLSNHPGSPETFGSLVLPAKAATGAWGVGQSGLGNRYLVTPDGRLFWSMGLNSVHDQMYTPVQYRQNCFDELPDPAGPFGSFYKTLNTKQGPQTCYSFQKQNLTYKYGAPYKPTWIASMKQRLASWGFNTVGMQSDSQMMDGSYPFTLILKTETFPTRLPTRYTHWTSLPDPYAAEFLGWTTTAFTDALAKYAGNNGLMGIYVDNEMSWGDTSSTGMRYNVPLGALNAPVTQPAKQALLAALKAKYVKITKLNTAWGTTFASWAILDTLSGFSPVSPSAQMQKDFNTFTTDFASTYYGKVKQALAAAGSTALYLGSRFSQYTPEVVAGASKHVDVLSFNVYRWADDAVWSYFDTLSRPVMISEWCVSAQDRGTFGGQNEVSSHAERARMIRAILNTMIHKKNIVGAHWFCYSDQPATGRYTDGENKGMGVVDITDTPYPETVAAFREIAASLYTSRG